MQQVGKVWLIPISIAQSYTKASIYQEQKPNSEVGKPVGAFTAIFELRLLESSLLLVTESKWKIFWQVRQKSGGTYSRYNLYIFRNFFSL